MKLNLGFPVFLGRDSDLTFSFGLFSDENVTAAPWPSYYSLLSETKLAVCFKEISICFLEDKHLMRFFFFFF